MGNKVQSASEEEWFMNQIEFNGRVYFSRSELACQATGMIRLAPGFAEKLLALRLVLNQPMKATSICRTKAHNESDAVKGNPRSFHVCDEPYYPTQGCCAIDVWTANRPPAYRQRLAEIARSLGWSIGFNPKFLHLDRRTDYTNLPRAEFNY